MDAESSVWQFFPRLFDALLSGDLIAISGVVITGLISTGLGWLLKKVYDHHRILNELNKKHEQKLRELKEHYEAQIRALRSKIHELKSRIEEANEAVEGGGLWVSKPVVGPTGHLRNQSIPILCIANLKGGVGKTTLSANIAAHFASSGKSILAIDLDFQGSLSSLRQQGGHQTIVGKSAANLLIRGELSSEAIGALLTPLQGNQNVQILPAYYDLARAENAIMLRWLTSKSSEDIRFQLVKTLHSDQIQKNFQAIVIDCPPRLTTAAIQALCASTHVLVPTVLDGLSAVAVDGFLDQLNNNRIIWPGLQLAGVVGTLTNWNIGNLTDDPYDMTHFQGAEGDGIRRLQASFRSLRQNYELRLPSEILLPHTTFVPRKYDIGRAAGEGIAYYAGNAEVKAVFERLGDEIAGRIGLVP